MKTIKHSKDITTLKVGDKVVFGNLEHTVVLGRFGYYLTSSNFHNDCVFKTLNVNKHRFIESLGIRANYEGTFPETKSLEALTAIVFALFKEYEKQNEPPKTWEEHCTLHVKKRTTCYFITGDSQILPHCHSIGISLSNKNLCQTEKDAEAFLALIQLRSLWHDYVGDFEFDWLEHSYYSICRNIDNKFELACVACPVVFCFPTKKLAKEFYINFKDLLEIAKPLL